ncbi:family 10 glycosylhydrolase [Salinibacter altiplanensis]|uniref:family 10 glycosylhydrolase n=1 Tax=Salinibacter altiplanensis TaxID=1803181 RepID=UPI000C9EE64A|nr:family 10 glycosylhydrolase [Salinibacter altiplanensis]
MPERRTFLKALGAGALGAAASGFSAPPERFPSDAADVNVPASPDAAPTNWVWMAPELDVSDDVWKRRFERLRTHNIDAILPKVYGNRAAYYGSAFLPVEGEWLETILPLAKEAGLEVHGWMVSMPCTIPEIVEQHKEWFVVNRNGASAVDNPAYVDYYKFTCPNRPGAQDFIERRVEEITSIAGLDGIHLDYIRFPDVVIAEALQPKYGIDQEEEEAPYDYCYCDVCRSKFEQKHGADPYDLEDPTTSTAWRLFRYDSITSLVNDRLVPIARQNDKAVSAATFPNWEAVRQRWHHWDLDAVHPMLYHNFYHAGANWVRDETRAGIERLRGQDRSTRLYSGLNVGAVAPGGLERLIDKAHEGDASGIALFAAGSMNDALWTTFAEATAGA